MTLLFPAVACTGREEPVATPAQGRDDAVERLANGWMGRYGRKDAALAKLLSAQEGWTFLREMDLYEAIRYFNMDTDPQDRIGAARSNLEMARTFDVLDNFFLDIEAKYLPSLGEKATPKEKARLGFVLLRRKDLQGAREIFSAPAPKGLETVWELGRVGLAIAENKDVTAKLQELCDATEKANRSLVRVATYIWGKPCNPGGSSGYYGQALTAMEAGDLFSGLVALQMLETNDTQSDVGPDLFLNALFRHVFARLSAEALAGVPGPEAAYLRGQALLLAGSPAKAVSAFDQVVGGSPSPEADAARLFGAEFDGREAAEMASVMSGYASFSSGKTAEAESTWKETVRSGLSPLAMARLAAVQAESGLAAPLEDPIKASGDALGSLAHLREATASLEGAEAVFVLLDAREARMSMDAARAARAAGKLDVALDRLDRAQQKKQGNRANFVNPPSFLVELSRAHADMGQFAPAVEIMFGLSNEFPSSRMVYESLKRLYASKTGGEAPPR